MSAWPPRWEDTFVVRETGKPPHYRTIQAELRKRGALFLALSNSEQMEIQEALYTIDQAASLAARELRKTPWSTAELIRLEPPEGAAPFAGVKEKKNFNRWLRHREHQSCIRFCRRARKALLIGKWGKAIHAALYAGQHLKGAGALSTQQSLPGLSGGSSSNQLRAKRYREIVLSDASELRAIRKKERRLYNVSTIAAEIEARHKNEHGFPRFDAIRRILGKDRSWESPS